MPMGTPDSPPVYEKPTEKAYLLIKLVDRNEEIRIPLRPEGNADDEDAKPGIVTRIIRRLSGRPI